MGAGWGVGERPSTRVSPRAPRQSPCSSATRPRGMHATAEQRRPVPRAPPSYLSLLWVGCKSPLSRRGIIIHTIRRGSRTFDSDPTHFPPRKPKATIYEERALPGTVVRAPQLANARPNSPPNPVTPERLGRNSCKLYMILYYRELIRHTFVWGVRIGYPSAHYTALYYSIPVVVFGSSTPW